MGIEVWVLQFWCEIILRFQIEQVLCTGLILKSCIRFQTKLHFNYHYLPGIIGMHCILHTACTAYFAKTVTSFLDKIHVHVQFNTISLFW